MSLACERTRKASRAEPINISFCVFLSFSLLSLLSLCFHLRNQSINRYPQYPDKSSNHRQASPVSRHSARGQRTDTDPRTLRLCTRCVHLEAKRLSLTGIEPATHPTAAQSTTTELSGLTQTIGPDHRHRRHLNALQVRVDLLGSDKGSIVSVIKLHDRTAFAKTARRTRFRG